MQSKGDLEKAAVEYKVFLVRTLRRIASLHAHYGRYEQAQKLLEAGLTLAPDNTDLLLDFAAMRLEQSNFSAAKSLAEKALKTKPDNPRAEYLIGNTLCQQGDYKSAKQHLEAAVVAAPNFETGYLLGLTYLKLNDLEHAQLLFDEMIKGLGDSARIHVYLGRAYRNGGYVDRAVEELKKAVAKDPNESQVHYFFGLAYLGRDSNAGFSEAAAEFRAELQRNPNDTRSHYLLGYILLKQRDLKEAETELLRANALDPKNPDSLIYLGQLYVETNRLDDAEKALRSAITLTDDISRNNYQISRAHYLLGRMLVDNGQKEEGKQELRTASELSNRSIQLERQRISGDSPNIAADVVSARQEETQVISSEDLKRAEVYIDEFRPAVADSYNNLGVIAASKKDFRTAVEYFRSVALWEPGLATLERNLGMAAFYANEFDIAVPPLSRHLRLHSDDLRVRAALALSLFALQKYDQVLNYLRPVESEVNADPGLSYAFAVSLVKTGDYKQGISRLRELEKVKTDSPDLHMLLGDALAEQNDWAAALQEYRQAVAIDPKQSRAHFLAGLASIRQGSPAEGVKEMREALRLNPSDAATKFNLAYALSETNNKQEAKDLLQQVLQQDPNHADAYYELGKLLLERGDAKGAITNFEASTKLKPDADYIHYQLAMAYRRDSRMDDARRELKVYQDLKARHRGRTPPTL
ncbi:MAG TPA: tetratricopeptide repeat protein [Terriglobales bacterium]|nr:tetratricopeptide repeat protein [Terriglobales bacterium]